MESVILKKIKMIGDGTKFSFPESFNDPNGKTSITKIVATFLLCLPGAIGFVIAACTKQSDLAVQSVAMSTLGSTVLLGCKIVNGKPIMEDHQETKVT